MILESYGSLLLTTLLLLGSPGPATMALAATGANVGVRKGLPFLCGLLLGLSIVIVGASLGISTLFSTFPQSKYFFQILGATYIVFIAWKIARAPFLPRSETAESAAPSLLNGMIFNLLNPKAYIAFAAIFSQALLPYTDVIMAYLVTGFLCFVVATIVDVVWLVFGGILRPMLNDTVYSKIIGLTFSVLMVLSVGLSAFF